MDRYRVDRSHNHSRILVEVKMKTDVVFAYALENNDVLVENEERGYPEGYVYMTQDDGDFITVDIVVNVKARER